MKKLLLILYALAATAYSQPVQFQWAEEPAASYNSMQNNVYASSGYVYSVGYFNTAMDADPGPGTDTLYGNGLSIYVSKINAAGHLVWADVIMHPGNDLSVLNGKRLFITADVFQNVYVTGEFSGIVDFDPGPGTYTAGSNSMPYNAFVLKLDHAGHFIWVKTFPSISRGTELETDLGNNICVLGDFGSNGAMDFDPGPGTYTVDAMGQTKLFFLKLDPTGNFLSVKVVEGSEAIFGTGMALDPVGNTYISGIFSGVADFDPGPGVYTFTSSGIISDQFILKLDPLGNFVWAKQFAGGAFSLASDGGGNIYAGGMLYDSIPVDLDPGPGVFNLDGNDTAMCVIKMDTSANFAWARKVRAGVTSLGDITVDPSGKLYVMGSYIGTSDFDPSSGSYAMSSAGNADAFIWSLDAAGNFVWAESIGGASSVGGSGIASDASGDIYCTGIFQNATVDFDPGPGTATLTSHLFDAYLCRFSTQFTGIAENEKGAHFSVSPNPSDGHFIVSAQHENKNSFIEVYNSTGTLLYGKQPDHENETIDLGSEPSGIYVIRLTDDKENSSAQKIIKQ